MLSPNFFSEAEFAGGWSVIAVAGTRFGMGYPLRAGMQFSAGIWFHI
jgi:hypothetical protein